MKKGDEPAFPIQIDQMKGGPIPIDADQSDEPDLDGLTKREYFAAKAMQGLITTWNQPIYSQRVVEESVLYADELLKELEK